MDKKRISGPDQSVRPFFPPSATSVIDVDSGERSDGRGAEEFRPLCESMAFLAKLHTTNRDT